MAKRQPESYAIDRIKNLMWGRGWFAFKTHGNAYQSGFPDLYCTHKMFRSRLVEVKMPWGRLTPAQKDIFPKLDRNGSPIWVIGAHWPLSDDQLILAIRRVESAPANWREYDK